MLTSVLTESFLMDKDQSRPSGAEWTTHSKSSGPQRASSGDVSRKVRFVEGWKESVSADGWP